MYVLFTRLVPRQHTNTYISHEHTPTSSVARCIYMSIILNIYTLVYIIYSSGAGAMCTYTHIMCKYVGDLSFFSSDTYINEHAMQYAYICIQCVFLRRSCNVYIHIYHVYLRRSFFSSDMYIHEYPMQYAYICIQYVFVRCSCMCTYIYIHEYVYVNTYISCVYTVDTFPAAEVGIESRYIHGYDLLCTSTCIKYVFVKCSCIHTYTYVYIYIYIHIYAYIYI